MVAGEKENEKRRVVVWGGGGGGGGGGLGAGTGGGGEHAQVEVRGPSWAAKTDQLLQGRTDGRAEKEESGRRGEMWCH